MRCERVRVMKKPAEEQIFTIKGVAMAMTFFSVYGVYLFSEDPDWVLWAWPMIMGALYVPDLPPPLFADPRPAFEMGLLFNFMSLLAVVFVMVLRGEAGLAWLSRLTAQFGGQRPGRASEAIGQSEVGAGTSYLDVDIPTSGC